LKIRWNILVGVSLLFCITAPILLQQGLPLGSDVDAHYWRTYFFSEHWAAGDWLPRWSPETYYGYGSPLFEYAAGGFYAIATVLGQLPFVDDVLRIKLTLALGLVLSFVGVYDFVARRYGVISGIICALSFVFSPAIIFMEPIGRASFPASLGMGFFAFTIATFDRYSKTQQHGILAALSLLGLLWSHNLTSFTGTAIIAGWLGWQWLWNRSEIPYWKSTFFIFVLGCGLSAFFWIPVALERDLVGLDRLQQSGGLDFRDFFQPLPKLLTLATLYDSQSYGQELRASLGIFSWGLSVLGVVTLLRHFSHRHPQFRESMFWGGIGVGSIYLVTPYSYWLWDNIEFLQIYLFSTRFMDFAAYGVALLAAPFIHKLVQRPSTIAQYSWLLIMMGLIFQGMQTLPWDWDNHALRAATTEAYFDYEIDSGTLGTTAANEFWPSSIPSIPPPSDFLIDSFSDVPIRVNRAAYPDTTFVVEHSDPTQYTFTVETPTEITLEVYQTYFSGWEATINNEPLSIYPVGQFGFTGMTIPAGSHTVALSYSLRDTQQVGLMVSFISLFGILLFGLYRWLRPANPSIQYASPSLSVRQAQHMIVVLIVMGIFGYAFMREGVAWVASPEGDALLAQHQMNTDFGEQVQLLGYTFSQTYGQQWDVYLYWQFPPPLDYEVNSFVHLVDANGTIYAQQDKFGMMRVVQHVTDWSSERHVRDWYRLELPDGGLPSGEYFLRVGLWQCETGEPAGCETVIRLPVYEDAQLISDAFLILPRTIHH